MRRAYVLMSLLLGLGVLSGCEREEGAARERETAADVQSDARFDTLIELATTHIENQNFQGAETALRELEAMRGELDESQRQQIETIRAALSAARQSGEEMPRELPGRPAPADAQDQQ
jgi:hypothetical protein